MHSTDTQIHKQTPLNTDTQAHRHTPHFHQVVWFIAGVQEEPDFLYKVVDAGLPSAAPHIQHPLVGRLIVFFPLIGRDVPGRETQGQTDRQTDRRIEI